MENLRTNSRSLILKTASSLFASQGFRATTLRQIAHASGANGALVAYYFGNKEGLRDAVIAEKLASMQASLRPLTPTQKKFTAKHLSKVVHTLFQHIREDESFHLLAQRALLEDPDFKKKLKNNLWNPLFELLTNMIREATKISPQEAEIRCLALCGMLQQYANLRCFFLDDFPGTNPSAKALAEYENYIAGPLVEEICRV